MIDLNVMWILPPLLLRGELFSRYNTDGSEISPSRGKYIYTCKESEFISSLSIICFRKVG